MKILFATGGTGGHIYPAIALAKKLVKYNDILFVGSTNRMEKDIVPEHGFRFESIKIEGYEGSFFARLKALFTLSTSYFEAKKIIKKFKPDLIIGFGGYVSLPVIKAGQSMKIKTMIHEQNSILGKTNKAVLSKVDGAVVCYENLLTEYASANMKLLGNPRASEICESFDQAYYDSLQLSKTKKKVLVVMGSQGSRTMSIKMIAFLNQANSKYEYLFVLGKRDYQLFKDKIKNPSVKVYEYLDQGKILAKMDLIIGRAGATTIAEITTLGVPSILIPSPYVANNHQFHNAGYLTKRKASIRIREDDVTNERMNDSLAMILEDDSFAQAMKKNALLLGSKNAITNIICFIEEIMNENIRV